MAGAASLPNSQFENVESDDRVTQKLGKIKKAGSMASDASLFATAIIPIPVDRVVNDKWCKTKIFMSQ